MSFNPHTRKNLTSEETAFKKLGPVEQKILLLLMAGATLALTQRPDRYFRIIKSLAKEWQRINRESLYNAIRRLYRSRMIDYKENNDGTVTLTISDDGKRRALKYDIDNIRIKKPDRWDGLWRIVIFDIPEKQKRARDALAFKLKNMGMLAIQKSVLVYPYNCKDEIDFIIEIFNLRPYVRFITAQEIDNVLDLKNKFHLL